MSTRKNIALTIGTFVRIVMSPLFDMLSRFVITFLLRSKIFNFVAAVTVHSDLESKKIKSVTVYIVSPSICHEVIGQRNQRSNCQHPLDHRKSKRVPEKHLFLLS